MGYLESTVWGNLIHGISTFSTCVKRAKVALMQNRRPLKWTFMSRLHFDRNLAGKISSGCISSFKWNFSKFQKSKSKVCIKYINEEVLGLEFLFKHFCRGDAISGFESITSAVCGGPRRGISDSQA
jgi:hypothetical protein